jgi:hypothetical protein
MSVALIRSFRSEWLKTRRSLASWIVVVGAFFTPVIIIVVHLVRQEGVQELYAAEGFWPLLWKNAWESMAISLLPLGIVLETGLLMQIEYKNNAWKQVHTAPLRLTTIFISKLSVVFVMLIQFFLLFNIGIWLAAIVPLLLIHSVPFPKDPIPWMYFLKEDALFFIDCLPLVAVQFLLSLRFRNFLVPVGMGFLLWIGALSSLSWRQAYVFPYTYPMFNYL